MEGMASLLAADNNDFEIVDAHMMMGCRVEEPQIPTLPSVPDAFSVEERTHQLCASPAPHRRSAKSVVGIWGEELGNKEFLGGYVVLMEER